MSALVAGRKEERRMRSKWAGQVEKGDLLGHGSVICLDSFLFIFFSVFFWQLSMLPVVDFFDYSFDIASQPASQSG